VKTRPCDELVTRGRLKKAEQFYSAAQTIRDAADDQADVGDAFVTLCVHAAIAAADAICCSALGEHAQGDSHVEAVQLLRRTGRDAAELAGALQTLLGLKTRAGYGDEPVNAEMRKRAERAAQKLVSAAKDRGTR
jgi:hypothetical protein